MAEMPDTETHDEAQLTRHLVVFLHGLWGSSGDFENFVAHLACQPNAKEFLLLPISKNSSTMDGVRKGAERALDEVRETVAACEQKVDRISIVGHSLGGIYARYLAYLLDHEGFLEDMEPIVFATFATPHLGARKPPGGPISAIWNTFVLRFCPTVRELGLHDSGFKDAESGASKPILYAMGSEEDFLRPLRRFKRRALYSNIKWDLQVPYPTTAIRHRNPYKSSIRLWSASSLSNAEEQESEESQPPAKRQKFEAGSAQATKSAEEDAVDSDEKIRKGIDDENVNEVASDDEKAEERAKDEQQAEKMADDDESEEGVADGALLAAVASPSRPPAASAELSKEMANFTAWSLKNVDKRRFWHSARDLEDGLIHAESPAKGSASAETQLARPSSASADSAFARDAKRRLLREMLFGLDVGVGGWERYDVSFLGFLAHEQIIYKRKFLPGKSVVEHFYKHVLHPAHKHQADPDAASFAQATTAVSRV
ncbi:Protein FAM135B [Hondaea fermentalgiana]|uniref:Protein FAM135B n=1 Tax=Hondaea fermentalgiana TaxID=2315210 RepID=A0A2R5GAE2_9STRA|nr:Protein FAM135B [Hondaea fermentalgiana]|eukprot:GBG26708.1 Protein FAM135B [Hondaea fermentalgiana]